jgi:hypothetical protein
MQPDQPRTTTSKPSAAPAKRAPARHRRLDTWRTLIVVAVLTISLGAGIWLAWRASIISSFEAAIAEADNTRTGAILENTRTGTIIEAANGQCRSFDNDTGRTSPADSSCNEAIRKSDATRRGTTGRINAISKAFFPNR